MIKKASESNKILRLDLVLAALGLELRASQLLGSHSYHFSPSTGPRFSF
jgi:hypothetical protein